jgi:hypothetical protein
VVVLTVKSDSVSEGSESKDVEEHTQTSDATPYSQIPTLAIGRVRCNKPRHQDRRIVPAADLLLMMPGSLSVSEQEPNAGGESCDEGYIQVTQAGAPGILPGFRVPANAAFAITWSQRFPCCRFRSAFAPSYPRSQPIIQFC